MKNTMLPPVINYRFKKKRIRKTREEKLAIIAEAEKQEAAVYIKIKLNGCPFAYWLLITHKKAERREYEAKTKNLPLWAIQDIERKTMALRQLQINWQAEYKLPLQEY